MHGFHSFSHISEPTSLSKYFASCCSLNTSTNVTQLGLDLKECNNKKHIPNSYICKKLILPRNTTKTPTHKCKMCSVLPRPLLPCSPFCCSVIERGAAPPKNCSWTDRSNCNAYGRANSPLSAPTALQYQSQASTKIRVPGTGCFYCLLLPPSFTALSLLAPVSRRR